MDHTLSKYPKSVQCSFNYMVISMQHIFKYLKPKEILTASKVCTSWNMVARRKCLWQTVRLKNTMVCNWNKCIDTLNDRCSVSLDMRRMLIPPKTEHLDKFWLEFTIALKNANRLKCLELYRCPAYVVENTICSLTQLTVLNATSIENPNISTKGKNPIEFMTLNLSSLCQMTNLTELRIKGHTGIKLINLPSFESLVNLKSLSLTSIRVFPEGISCTLGTLPISLEFLEIGDCDGLSKDFVGVLKRLTNLTYLRLENCSGEFNNIAKEVFCSIRGLDKLKILELINIDFSDNVKEELEKCTNIKALLIIPMYENNAAATNSLLIDCLQKLSVTLTHLVWGLTLELLCSTESVISHYQPSLLPIGRRCQLLYFPILGTIEQRLGDEYFCVIDMQKHKSESIKILLVPYLKNQLKAMMKNAKTKVIKIPLEKTTLVYLKKYFNDL